MVPKENKSSRQSSGPPLEFILANRFFAEKHPRTIEQLSKHHLIYSISGLLLGLACVIGGVVLFLNGVIGSASWTAKMLGAESQVSDAAPGVVLFIVGVFIVLITRYVVKIPEN